MDSSTLGVTLLMSAQFDNNRLPRRLGLADEVSNLAAGFYLHLAGPIGGEAGIRTRGKVLGPTTV